MKIFIVVFFYLCISILCLEANNTLISKEELKWIQNHQEIKVGVERDWIPFDYVNKDGQHAGISQDYLKKISDISGLNFKTYPNSWKKLLEQIKAKEIDMLPALYYSKERSTYINFTHSYLDLAEYLFTLRKVNKLLDRRQIYNKTIVVVRGFEVEQWLRKKHPRAKILFKDSIYDCLQSVSTGESFGFIGDLPSTQAIMQKYFINNIKVNTILSDRDPISVHMGIRKDYFILESIISKSLDLISRQEKKNIFTQYASDVGVSGLNAAFGFGRPPYMYDKNSGKGMEENLVRKILKNRGLVLNGVKQMPIQRGQNILLQNSKIDISVGVLEDKNDGLFYSDNFIKYENVAITRRSDNIKIKDIQDLKNKTVIAWEQASKMLGSEFETLFNLENKLDNYTEASNQKIQHQNFFLKKADVILVDKNVFKWYVNKYKYRYDTRQEYDIHPIFFKSTWVKVSFRDKRLRDEFNLGLQALKDNGKYEKIISQSLQIDLEKQLNLVQFIAAISAEYIFEGDTLTLKKILSKFNNINIIKGIEFITTNKDLSLLKLERHGDVYKEVPAFSWGNEQSNMIYKPSFLHENGMPVEVGSIKVYYNIEELKDIDISYIPDIKIFEDLSKEEYEEIKKAYKHLSIDFVLSKLSIKEQQWIQEHPLIRFVGDPNWLPFEAFDKKGNYIGIVSEYLKEIESITGLRFEKIQTSTWEESVNLIKDKKADMISETTDSELSSFLSFTNAYLQNYIVIVMKSKAEYVDSISQIQDKKIVVMKDYGYVSKIKKAYPKVQFIEAEDISEGLSIISSGKADALLCTMALGAYHISKDGFVNLRIVGKTEFSTSLGYGIQKEMKPLVSILNKSILALDEGKKQEILKKWITQKYVEKMDYTLAWQVLGAAFILLALFLYWNRQMQKEIKRRIEIEGQLYEANTQVKESIEFSSMIQRALIPDKKEFETFFCDYFTLWKPRDIVGGDIYFFEALRTKEEGILMVIDCTGHGVPGAFITMLVKALERNMVSYIISKKDEISPAELLKVFNKSMKHLLKQHDKSAESNAGFDAGILYINKKEMTARYAGAELSLYYSDANKIKRLKGNRQSVGYRNSDLEYVYKDYEIALEKDMKFYITTDGYQDQNGGAKGFPFGRKKFQNILEEMQEQSMQEVKKKLLKELSLYQGSYEANDDITIVGVRI